MALTAVLAVARPPAAATHSKGPTSARNEDNPVCDHVATLAAAVRTKGSMCARKDQPAHSMCARQDQPAHTTSSSACPRCTRRTQTICTVRMATSVATVHINGSLCSRKVHPACAVSQSAYKRYTTRTHAVCADRQSHAARTPCAQHTTTSCPARSGRWRTSRRKPPRGKPRRQSPQPDASAGVS